MYERQGIAVMTPTVPGSPQGPFLGIPRGTMRRQKSIGKMFLMHSSFVHYSPLLVIHLFLYFLKAYFSNTFTSVNDFIFSLYKSSWKNKFLFNFYI